MEEVVHSSKQEPATLTVGNFCYPEPFHVSRQLNQFLHGLECCPPCSPADRALTHASRSHANDTSFP